MTEFLPVSSSAHLVIFQDLFQIQENQILLDIVLHLGTLLALVVFLFKDFKYILGKRIIFLIFLVTAWTAVIAVLGKDFFINMFFSARGVVWPLLITGLVLLYTRRFTLSRKADKRTFTDLKISDAIWLGIVQGFSVIPGISRSGVTISTLLFRNVDRETDFKFSFLAALPAILGALIFEIRGFSHLGRPELKYMLFGFLAAFFSGLLALRILLSIIRKARLHLFGYYCLALAFLIYTLA